MAWPVSERFRAALSRSHRIVVEADIVSPVTGRTVLAGLPVVAGQVVVDRTATVRRTCSLTLAVPPELVDEIPTPQRRTPLDPYGNELKVRRGIRFRDGSTELCPLGVFRIDGSNLEEHAGLQLTVTGVDRAQAIADARFAWAPHVIARGTNVATAITTLVGLCSPVTVTAVTVTTATTTPQILVDGQSSPWEAVQQLAASIGAEAYFDPEGTLIVAETPDPSIGVVDWDYAEGPDCQLISLGRPYTAADIRNAVVVTGETGQGDTPVVGYAVDDDPNSPTYWFGPFGQRPLSETSPLATTAAQATLIANRRLRELAGLSEKVQLTVVPNPAVDVDDLLHVERRRSGFDDDLIVEATSVPLDAGTAMSITCRTRRISPT